MARFNAGSSQACSGPRIIQGVDRRLIEEGGTDQDSDLIGFGIDLG